MELTQIVRNRAIWMGAGCRGGMVRKGSGVAQEFSQCGPWTSSIGFPWKAVRHANSQAVPQPYGIRHSGGVPRIQQATQGTLMHTQI